MDLWLLVDVSESVSEEDFQNVKNFSRKLREIFPYSGVRFGWSLYSFAYEAVFKFSNQQDWFIETINAATRPLGERIWMHGVVRKKLKGKQGGFVSFVLELNAKKNLRTSKRRNIPIPPSFWFCRCLQTMYESFFLLKLFS